MKEYMRAMEGFNMLKEFGIDENAYSGSKETTEEKGKYNFVIGGINGNFISHKCQCQRELLYSKMDRKTSSTSG